jgi:hypothetical protein
MTSTKRFMVPAIAAAALSLTALGSTPALAAAQHGTSPQTVTAAHANQQARPLNVVLGGGQTLHSGQSIDSGTVTLIMQGDGNLVLYQDGGVGDPSHALWATHTTGSNYAIMQSDGNFVVYPVGGGGALWASGTFGDNVLDVQTDGNLVIYPADRIGDPSTAEWATNTNF